MLREKLKPLKGKRVRITDTHGDVYVGKLMEIDCLDDDKNDHTVTIGDKPYCYNRHDTMRFPEYLIKINNIDVIGIKE